MDFECHMYYILEFERHGEVICSLNSMKEMEFQTGLKVFGQVGIPSK